MVIRAQVLRHLHAIVRLDELAIPSSLTSVVGPVEVAALQSLLTFAAVVRCLN